VTYTQLKVILLLMLSYGIYQRFYIPIAQEPSNPSVETRPNAPQAQSTPDTADTEEPINNSNAPSVVPIITPTVTPEPSPSPQEEPITVEQTPEPVIIQEPTPSPSSEVITTPNSSGTKEQRLAAITSKEKLNILFIGDSITTLDGGNVYSAIILKQPWCGECKVVAKSSMNTKWGKTQLNNELATTQVRWDLVVILMGTNYVSTTHRDLPEIYRRARAYGAEVVAATPPGSQYFSPNRVPDDIKLAEEMKSNPDVLYVADFATNKKSDFTDGTHPTLKRHKEMADILAKTIGRQITVY
jgi:hypothetical protein